MGISLIPHIPKVDTTFLHWNPLTSINEENQHHTDQGISNATVI